MAKSEITQDSKRLANQEGIVRANLGAAFKIGEALGLIRDGLYKASQQPDGEPWKNFAAYCEGVWGFTGRHANRMIAAAEAYQAIRGGDSGPIGLGAPTHESQVRHLTALDSPEQQAEAWKNAVKKAEAAGTVLTEAMVKEEVKGWQADPEPPAGPKPPPPPARKPEPPPRPEPLTDKRGKPVPPRLRPAFTETRKQLDTIAREINDIKKRLKAIQAEEDCRGAYIELSLVNTDLKNVHTAVQFARAEVVHEKCKGKGCDLCKNSGFLTAKMAARIPEGA